ncbi:hypothetical protein MES5069_700011 [Mesorhizobium escarrei]|uniref:HTH lysR-type domain-containing protein n=1 Tax=Mesorhizobium escarrei TaxID=666018 RepID=A0ABM9EHD9_9HYPH|nr:LysR family transcriptional regulator [Mesorhizobium escarrei]CAH2408783.1 hypothetical protein MES5069_700011 [Mesorhizobium escarrei]
MRRSLNVSQPSVSRLLQELEIGIGLSLFDRSHGRLVPTEQGLLFYGEVSKTFHGARNLIMAAQEIRELKRGVVRIGTLAAMSFKIVPEAIPAVEDAVSRSQDDRRGAHSTEIVSSVDFRSQCPCCGGRMIVIEVFEQWRQPRGPPDKTATNRENSP